MLTKVDQTLIETLMYAGTWLSSSDYQAANSAIDIARENATTAAALATALATINTLTTQKAAALLARDAAIAAKDEEFRLKNLAINAFSNHMVSHSSGTSGTLGTTTTTTLASGPPQVAPSISTSSVGTAGPGVNFNLAGNFPAPMTGTSSGVSFGSTYASSIGAQYSRTNQSTLSVNVPHGMTSGNYKIYAKNPAGVGTSPFDFNVVGAAPPTVIVQWKVYVGDPIGALSANRSYTQWFPPNNQPQDSLVISTENAQGTEVLQVTLSTNATINAYSGSILNGPYISGSFSVPLVNNQLKIKLVRTLSNGANTDVGHRNQVKLGTGADGDPTIHFQTRHNSAAGVWDPYFDNWVWNSNTAYAHVPGDWMIFTASQLFSNVNSGVQLPLYLEAVTQAG